MRLLENDAPSSLSRGLPNPDLLQHLGRLMSDALDHINSCPSCREKGYGVCTLCYSASHNNNNNYDQHDDDHDHQQHGGSSSSSNKVAFWEDGAACEECGSIYHASCYEVKGCPKCNNAK